jgi:hypothetical protein
MAPKKLTETDKQAILGLYRQPEETTSTLAERYGVSNSTISRLLKASLPEEVYSALIQQKRSGADKSPALLGDESSLLPLQPLETAAVAHEPIPGPVLRRRRGPTEAPQAPIAQPSLISEPLLPALEARVPLESDALTGFKVTPPDLDLAEDWQEEASTLDEDYDEEDDEDEDEDEEDEDEDRMGWSEAPGLTSPLGTVEIYPLTASALPPLCYLVVEKVSSELVVLPLRTFANLGEIPEAEGDARTLPVFGNHHGARRFSRRSQRVIKVPDGNLLKTTGPYLQAKGITRLLIDGQVFALEEPVATV